LTTLGQIVGVRRGALARNYAEVIRRKRQLEKPALVTGITRTYEPKDPVEGDHLPPERTRVQLLVEDELREMVKLWTRSWDLTATQDEAHTRAFADVELDGETLLRHVPVTTLLYLEKQLSEVAEGLRAMPTLDAAEDWEFSDEARAYRTPVIQNVRTKKVPRNHVKAMPTPEFPNIIPQVEVWQEDVQVGTWTTRKLSGAMFASRKAELLDKVERLRAAVKFATERANQTTVEDQHVGKPLLDWLMA
jgi:hypothetical protein